jgi:hypothetical protein
LRTLVEDFAETPEAFEAQRRLMVIELESRWRGSQETERPKSNDS